MTIYVMPQATVLDWESEHVLPDVDEYSYRGVEGHGADKAFRYNGFEKHRSNNPNILHTYDSDTFLRLKTLFDAGNLAVNDRFILGIAAPSLTELDMIVVRQQNTVPGLQMSFTVLDGNLAQVEAEGISIDFAEGCTDGRWDNQRVQKFRYNNAGTAAFAGEGEIFFLVAQIDALPAAGAWLSDCTNPDVPEFQVRVHYNDSCLTNERQGCAPVAVYNAWQAAIGALTEPVVLWNDVDFDKSPGGFKALKTPPTP